MLLAQGINYLNPHEFSGIKSEGKIPEDFRLNWASRFQSSYSSTPNANLKNSDKKKLEEFWGSQYYMVDGIMQSGRLVFNHPCENLQEIILTVLKSTSKTNNFAIILPTVINDGKKF